MLRSIAVAFLATLLAGHCLAAGPLLVDLDAQADVVAEVSFKAGDANRDKSLNDKEQKKALQDLQKRFVADARKLGAHGLAMVKIAAMISDGKPDVDADGVVSRDEFCEFVRDAWTERLEIILGPPPVAAALPPPPPVVVVGSSPSRKDDDNWNRRRELDRHERQRLMQLEWERRQRLAQQRSSYGQSPMVIDGSSGPGRVNSRRETDGDKSSGDRKAERTERSSSKGTERRPSANSGRSASRSDKDDKPSSTSRGSRSR